MKKFVAAMLALALCIAMLSGCAKDEQPAAGDETPDPVPEADKTEPFVYQWVRSAEETTLNPHMVTVGTDNAVNCLLYAPLYAFVPTEEGTVALQPDLAAADPVSTDGGITWTIRISPDAKWANGEVITARDFEYSYRMQLDPGLAYQSGTLMASDYIVIKNAAAYWSQGSSASVRWEDVGIRALDDQTLQITCERPYTEVDVKRHFNYSYTSPVYEPIYSTCISADGTTCDYGTSVDKTMFSGMFTAESWVKASELILNKNPNYLHADLIHIDRIVSRCVTDESTRLELFEQGESDFVTLGTNGYAKYSEDPRVSTYPSTAIQTIEFNQNHPEKPWLDDPLFRKAVFYAIDRNAIARLTNNLACPYFLSVMGQALDDGTKYRDLPEAQALVPANGGYDPDLAKSYLKQVMAKYGLTSVTVDLAYNETSAAARTASEFIQTALQALFGADQFRVTLSAGSFANLNATMRSSTQGPVSSWDMSWSSWGITSEKFAPYRKMERYTTTYTRRYTMYKNTALDQLWAQCLLEENRLDDEKLAALTVQMEQTMYEDMTCCPVYGVTNYAMFSERISVPLKEYDPSLEFGWQYVSLK